MGLAKAAGRAHKQITQSTGIFVRCGGIKVKIGFDIKKINEYNGMIQAIMSADYVTIDNRLNCFYRCGKLAGWSIETERPYQIEELIEMDRHCVIPAHRGMNV